MDFFAVKSDEILRRKIVIYFVGPKNFMGLFAVKFDEGDVNPGIHKFVNFILVYFYRIVPVG